MKKQQKANKSKQKTRPSLNSQPTVVSVPTAATELSEEDLKRVTGGSFSWGVSSNPEIKIG